MPNFTQEDIVYFLQSEAMRETIAGLSMMHLHAICKYFNVQSYTSMNREKLASAVTSELSWDDVSDSDREVQEESSPQQLPDHVEGNPMLVQQQVSMDPPEEAELSELYRLEEARAKTEDAKAKTESARTDTLCW